MRDLCAVCAMVDVPVVDSDQILRRHGIVESLVEAVVEVAARAIIERRTRLTSLYIVPVAKNQIVLVVASLTMGYEFSR